MPKKPVEDIVLRTQPRTKKVLPRPPIGEVVPGVGIKTPETSVNQKIRKEDEILETLFNKERHLYPEEKKRSWVYALLGLVGIGVLGFIVLSFMASADIVITPRNEEQEILLSVLARKDSEGDALFKVSNMSLSLEDTLPSKGVKEVDKRASVKIRVFNEYSTSPQKLIARTRFETKEGLVYRISDAVQVPGMIKKGGTITPGSIEVSVFANEPGEKYNISFSDFTAPGLKGTPMYEKIFARSVTPATGGFSGTVNIVDENELEQKRAKLQEELEKKLLLEETALSLESITFPDGLFLTYNETIDDEAREEGGNPVPYKITGELERILLSRQELVAHIIASLFPNVSNPPTDIRGIENLTYEIKDKDLITSPKTADGLTITIRGKARFVWSVPLKTIKEKLAGIPKDDAALEEMFKREFPNLNLKVQVRSVRPRWSQSFPDDPEDITIQEVFDLSEI